MSLKLSCTLYILPVLPLTFYTWFNCVSILVILIDCAAQGSFQPCEGEHLIQEVRLSSELLKPHVTMNCILSLSKNGIFLVSTQVIEVGVTVYFTMELIIKMRALGDYPRNRWHKLDIYILCVEYVTPLIFIPTLCFSHKGG